MDINERVRAPQECDRPRPHPGSDRRVQRRRRFGVSELQERLEGFLAPRRTKRPPTGSAATRNAARSSPWMFLRAFAVGGLLLGAGCTGPRYVDMTGLPERGSGANPHDALEPPEQARTRPSNQVAALTVWAEAEKLGAAAEFYGEVLGLRRVGTGTAPYTFDADGTFVVVMEGQPAPPRATARRWPMFTLTVPDLHASVATLRAARVELPWGMEESGAPQPSSHSVMFRDPAGNLIELVQWL